jgi:hypothetical protein
VIAAAGAGGSPESPRRRRLRLGLLGCGSLLLAFVVAATIAGYVVSRYPREFRAALGALFESLEESMATNFSARVTPAEREEFRAARARFHEAWNAGRIDLTTADLLRRRLLRDSGKPRLEPDDVENLTQFLNRLSGRPSAPPATRSP